MSNIKVITIDRVRNPEQVLLHIDSGKVLLIGDLSYEDMYRIESIQKKNYEVLMISTTSMDPAIHELSSAFSICLDARLLAAFYIMLKGCGVHITVDPSIHTLAESFGIDINTPISPSVQSPFDIVPVYSNRSVSYQDQLMKDVILFSKKLDGLYDNFNKRYLITLWNNFVLFNNGNVSSRYNTVDYRTSLPMYGKINVQKSSSTIYTIGGTASEPFMMSYMQVSRDPAYYTTMLEGQEDTSRLLLTMINNEGDTVC